MPARALITGATGFVGSHITAAFTEAGYKVRCGIRASSNTRWIDGLGVDYVPMDFDRTRELAEAVKGIDVVVHAAGLTRASQANDYYQVNAEGTRRIAAAALDAGVQRFILVSSLAARGPDALIKNGDDHPVSPYGLSKLEAEAYLRTLKQMETIVLRPAAVYGPRDTDLLPLFKMAHNGWLFIPSDPGPLQPVYAADVAQVVLAAAHKAVGFGPFPIAEAVRYAWHEVAFGLQQALGRSVRTVRLPAAIFGLAGRAAELIAKPRGSVPIFDERRAKDLTIHTWTCDPSSSERALGWRAEISLFEGLERTVKWYRKIGWL